MKQKSGNNNYLLRFDKYTLHFFIMLRCIYIYIYIYICIQIEQQTKHE